MNHEELIKYTRDLTGVYSSDVVSDNLILRWLNEAYNEVARDRDWDWLELTYSGPLPAAAGGVHTITLPYGTRRVLSAYLIADTNDVTELVQTSELDHVEPADGTIKYDVNFSGVVRIAPVQDQSYTVKIRYTRSNVALEDLYQVLWTMIASTNDGNLLTGSGAPDPSDGDEGEFYVDTVAQELYGPKGVEDEVGDGDWPFVGSQYEDSPPTSPTLALAAATAFITPPFYYDSDAEELYFGDLSLPTPSTPVFDMQFHQILSYRAAIKVLQFVSDDTNRSEYYASEFSGLLLGMYELYELDHDYRTFQLGQDGVNTRKYLPWFRPA